MSVYLRSPASRPSNPRSSATRKWSVAPTTFRHDGVGARAHSVGLAGEEYIQAGSVDGKQGGAGPSYGGIRADNELCNVAIRRTQLVAITRDHSSVHALTSIWLKSKVSIRSISARSRIIISFSSGSFCMRAMAYLLTGTMPVCLASWN